MSGTGQCLAHCPASVWWREAPGTPWRSAHAVLECRPIRSRSFRRTRPRRSRRTGLTLRSIVDAGFCDGPVRYENMSAVRVVCFWLGHCLSAVMVLLGTVPSDLVRASEGRTERAKAHRGLVRPSFPQPVFCRYAALRYDLSSPPRYWSQCTLPRGRSPALGFVAG